MVLVLAAILLVVMLGFAALVIDMGNARALRRDAQNAADAASLAAAAELPNGFAAARAVAEQYVDDNVDEYGPWAGCDDPKHLPHTPHTATNGTCISYDSATNPKIVRVRVPPYQEATFFGGILGSDSITVSAAAEAEIGPPPGIGGILPFGLYGVDSGEAGEMCLMTGPNTPDPCANGPVTGAFGLLDLRRYGGYSPLPMLGAQCGPGGSGDPGAQKARNVRNIAFGADHHLATRTPQTAPGVIDDCYNRDPDPNQIHIGPGLTQDHFQSGMVADTNIGGSGYDARLRQGSLRKETVLGYPLDDVALWEFIPPGSLSGVPASCNRSVFDAAAALPLPGAAELATHAALKQCFDDYRNGGYSGELFTRPASDFGMSVDGDPPAILQTPRFAWVPSFWQSTPGNPSTLADIKEFRAVYIHRLFAGCSNGNGGGGGGPGGGGGGGGGGGPGGGGGGGPGGGTCNLDYTPGPFADNGGSGPATGVSAFVFDLDMLPSEIADSPPFLFREPRGVALYR
ncbi:MAG TPA: pilus assembly protein TadG-related protein [Vicinamibacterales bacterium]|nr:pilus assembly protein TadG-related protein [Vicinamibacterales bacterium]